MINDDRKLLTEELLDECWHAEALEKGVIK